MHLPIQCHQCSHLFTPITDSQRFCSTKCRTRHHYLKLHDRDRFLYIIQMELPPGCEKQNCFKVGISDTPTRRLKELQSQFTQRLKLLSTSRIPGGRVAFNIENQIHKRLKSYCLRREWFDASIAEIAAIIIEILESHDIRNYKGIAPTRFEHVDPIRDLRYDRRNTPPPNPNQIKPLRHLSLRHTYTLRDVESK